MEITDMKVRRLEFPAVAPRTPYYNGSLSYYMGGKGSASILEITTDEGVTGFTLMSRLRGGLVHLGGYGLVELLKEQVIGEDPFNLERIWHKMYMGTWRKPVAKGDMINAISNVDNALWDLLGKITKQPVYKLLGGFRDKVPVYAAGGYYINGMTLSDLAKEMAGYVDEGFRAVKMKIGRLSLEKDVERVKTVRDAVGDNVKIMIDANNAFTAFEAIRFAKAVEKYNPYWFEEPVPTDDVAGSIELKNATIIPIASGENEFTRWGFRDLIERRAVDIIQADVGLAGGFTEIRKIAAMASAHHIDYSPHGQHVIGAHAVAGVPNGQIVESYAKSPFTLASAAVAAHFYHDPIVMKHGFIEMPQKPGYGIELDEKVVEKYEVKKRTSRVPDSSEFQIE